MCAISEGSGETARDAGRVCDKYHNLMSWLISKELNHFHPVLTMDFRVQICISFFFYN